MFPLHRQPLRLSLRFQGRDVMEALTKMAALAALAILAGCSNAAREVVPDPSTITVEAALTSVMRGLRLAEIEARSSSSGQALGLNPCTVDVVFNITAGGTHKNELVLDANIKGGNAIVSGTGEVKNTTTNESMTSRGNQITVVLTSPACNPKDTLGTVHPDKIAISAAQAESIRKGKDTVYSQPVPRIRVR